MKPASPSSLDMTWAVVRTDTGETVILNDANRTALIFDSEGQGDQVKRFYCRPCGRIRRANSYPADVVMIDGGDGRPMPLEVNIDRRHGTCWRHGRGRPMPRPERVMRHSAPIRQTAMATAMTSAKKGKR